MKQAGKQVIVDFIIVCLKKGEQRGEILGKCGKKWGISRTAFDRWLKKAKEQHAEQQAEQEKKLAKDTELKELEARKAALMTSIEKKELLVRRIKHIEAAIISGETDDYIKTPKGILNVKGKRKLNILEQAALSETLKSLTQELNKMDGHYAPAKFTPVDNEGNVLKQTMIINGIEITF